MRNPPAPGKAPPASVKAYIADMLGELARLADSIGEPELASSIRAAMGKAGPGSGAAPPPHSS